MSRIGSRACALDASNQSRFAPPRAPGAASVSRLGNLLKSSPRWSRVASYLLATAAESELIPSCVFVLALDVPAMADVAFVALILDRGERRRYRTRRDRVNGAGGRRRRRADDETTGIRVFSPRVDVSRDRLAPVRPPRSAYGVNQLVPSRRWETRRTERRPAAAYELGGGDEYRRGAEREGDRMRRAIE